MQKKHSSINQTTHTKALVICLCSSKYSIHSTVQLNLIEIECRNCKKKEQSTLSIRQFEKKRKLRDYAICFVMREKRRRKCRLSNAWKWANWKSKHLKTNPKTTAYTTKCSLSILYSFHFDGNLFAIECVYANIHIGLKQCTNVRRVCMFQLLH